MRLLAHSSGLSCPFTTNSQTNIKTHAEYIHCCLCDAHLSVKTFPLKWQSKNARQKQEMKTNCSGEADETQREALLNLSFFFFVSVSFMKENLSSPSQDFFLWASENTFRWGARDHLLLHSSLSTLQPRCQSTGVLRGRHQKTKQGKSCSRFHLRKWDQLRI